MPRHHTRKLLILRSATCGLEPFSAFQNLFPQPARANTCPEQPLRVIHIAYGGIGGTGSVVTSILPGTDAYGPSTRSRVIFFGVECVHSMYTGRLAASGIPFDSILK